MATVTSSLRYPNEILHDTTDYFQIQIFDYNKGDLLTSGAGGTLLHTIFLPIPSNVQDGNSVSYGEDELNSLTAGGLGIAETLMGINFTEKGAYENALNAVMSAGGQAANMASTYQSTIIKALAAQAVSVFGGNVSINSLLAREEGKILNPNMELLFNGVTLRSFRFSFKMTPRDNIESYAIKHIIRTLKQHMSAKGSVGNTDRAFLNSPDVFQLAYKKGKNDHPFLHKFKPCFLKDISVNYTGENVYTTYSDGTPVSMSMDLTFQEMFPIYADDYKELKDTDGVGY